MDTTIVWDASVSNEMSVFRENLLKMLRVLRRERGEQGDRNHGN